MVDSAREACASAMVENARSVSVSNAIARHATAPIPLNGPRAAPLDGNAPRTFEGAGGGEVFEGLASASVAAACAANAATSAATPEAPPTSAAAAPPLPPSEGARGSSVAASTLAAGIAPSGGGDEEQARDGCATTATSRGAHAHGAHGTAMSAEGQEQTRQRVEEAGRASDDEGRLRVELEVERAWLVDASGASRPLNTYAVCRLCPLMHGHDDGALEGAEAGVVRSDVCWGTSSPTFRLSHIAYLQSEPELRRAPPPRTSAAGSSGWSGSPTAGTSRSHEVVLEVWAIADDTQAESLVGLVRTLVKVPASAASQRFATTIIDGARAIVNPFDITTRGELTVRLRVGTAVQLRDARQLRLAVGTIQLHWRRTRNAAAPPPPAAHAARPRASPRRDAALDALPRCRLLRLP